MYVLYTVQGMGWWVNGKFNGWYQLKRAGVVEATDVAGSIGNDFKKGVNVQTTGYK